MAKIMKNLKVFSAHSYLYSRSRFNMIKILMYNKMFLFLQVEGHDHKDDETLITSSRVFNAKAAY